ncbi:MAG TPA: TetR/AcrR family transcriptional regulator [Mycobacterium sp.]|nr:TetR/AcrR family transcriptional regulator [Mycobacterium sp.]
MRRKEKQAQTRAALVEAAREVLAERGLADTSLDGIAARAGYTKGAVYANFTSKEELYLALLDERFAGELERLTSALAGVEPPTEEARGAAREFMRFVWSDPAWPRLFLEFTVYASRDETYRRKLAERYRELHDRITELYQRWSADFPVPPPIPLDAITTMTFCMANGSTVERMIRPDIDEQIYPTMLEVFVRGLMAMAEERAHSKTAAASS